MRVKERRYTERFDNPYLVPYRDCVSARDPYCMWDRDTRGCVMNPFSASQNGMETVNSIRYMQNIHKGSGDTDGCTGL